VDAADRAPAGQPAARAGIPADAGRVVVDCQRTILERIERIDAASRSYWSVRQGV
jgi:hypothetical protein